ncbi:hypothetical protein G3578_13540 [Brevibacillus sp. SYP-B805]|uniref:hypothetical protein n=1 Tax=Brevibacillus sp. SYP-B805 TaxID=1578199 RepID=UPI0013EC2480|nr:hypothetical protein [Brevibacillus sp. SYP-B805]NGQ96184.1 hypothetical protein [Brevibacillus sp. SYP-B805]
MFSVGDYVVFIRDGAKGVVIGVENNRCQVMWEDFFVSWEDCASLRIDAEG